jgi:hypothetical protein
MTLNVKKHFGIVIIHTITKDKRIDIENIAETIYAELGK